MASARASDSSWATSLNSTRPAPTAASDRVKTRDRTAPRRSGCPFGAARNAQAARTATSTSTRPLLTRCEYSTSVAVDGRSGTTSPLHDGQWLPQPAPEPLART